MAKNNGNFPPLVATVQGNFVTFLTPCIVETYDPTENDVFYQLFQSWMNSTTGNFFVYSGNGIWTQLATGSGSGVQGLEGNTGGEIFPLSGLINVVGAGGVNVAGSGNTLTITSGSSSTSFTDEATSFSATAGNGYFLTAALTATLPPSPAQGSEIIIAVDTTAACVVAAAAGNFIRVGSGISSSGGSATNNARGDSLTLYFRAADSTWISTSDQGTWTLA